MKVLCRHCQRTIIRVTYALGACWMHDPVGQGRTADLERYCRMTTAGPPSSDPETNTGIYKESGDML